MTARAADKKILDRVHRLREEIDRHNRLYYVQNAPEITDFEFDKLLAELIELETQYHLQDPDSPSQRVGGQPIEGFVTVAHAVPMMSVDNTYSEADLRAWDQRVKKGLAAAPGSKSGSLFGGDDESVKIAYVCQPKIDGVAISLRYEKGRLVQAVTRGDGQRGDDITVNARTIQSIPLALHAPAKSKAPPAVLEIRGEVFMTFAGFDKINQQREESGEPLFANPRNSTAGTLKQLDPKIVAQRDLRFYAHSAGVIEGAEFDSFHDYLASLQNWGVPVPLNTKLVHSVDEVWKYIEQFDTARRREKYPVDGVVVKVDDFTQQKTLGMTSKAPRWCIAYKYAPDQATTKLLQVDWQVGKTGKLTPRATMEPVLLAGTTVSHATLHNADEIDRRDIHLGDTVVIEKAGEIIPQVVEVKKELRPPGAQKIKPPEKCPSCASPIVREEGEAAHRCINPECPAQFREKLIWFAGRGQMDIEGMGEKTVDQLINTKLVTRFADVFELPDKVNGPYKDEIELALSESWLTIRDKVLGVIFFDSSESESEIIIQQLKSRLLDSNVVKRVNHPIKHPSDGFAGARRAIIRILFGYGLIRDANEEDFDVDVAELIRNVPGISVVNLKSIECPKRSPSVVVQNLIEGIQKAKSKGLARLLSSIGIRHVGNANALILAKAFGTIDGLLSATEKQISDALSQVDEKESRLLRIFADKLVEYCSNVENRSYITQGVGSLKDVLDRIPKSLKVTVLRANKLVEYFKDTQSFLAADSDAIVVAIQGKRIARSLFVWLHSQVGMTTIESLRSLGVDMTYHVNLVPSVVSKNSLFQGKNCVLTGTLASYSRSQLTELLQSMGAKVVTSVSKNTNMLIVGDNPGSKLQDAEKYGVPIVKEDELVKMLRGTN